MKVSIIVAGGSGLRMGADIPKQFLCVADKPILMHTLERFHQYDASMALVLVLPESQTNYWKELCDKYHFDIPHAIVYGGESRFHSVNNGVQYVKNKYPIVSCIAVHDGVRPLVSLQTLENCFSDALRLGSAIPVMPAIESVRLIDNINSEVSHACDRRRVMMVQTPQVFTSDILYNSYALDYRETFTDDASVCEAAGYIMHLSQGNKENVKITTPDDLQYAEIILSRL